MIIPDLNLLLYAYDSTSPAHKKAAVWWQNLLSGTDPVGLAEAVIFGFMRVATSTRAFRHPMTVAEASGHVAAWLAQPSVQILKAGPNHVTHVLGLLKALGAAGNLVSDAQLAALAIEHEAVIHTADADFSRFENLQWFNPLTGLRSRRVRNE